MELHPFLSQLEQKDLERYMNACKDELWDFLENLGLSDALTLQVLEDVRTSLLKNCNSLFLSPSDIRNLQTETSKEG